MIAWIWRFDGEVYWGGMWLRSLEWFLKSSKDGLDLFWMWQRAWNGLWMETWFSYIYIYLVILKIVVPFRRPYYRTSHCYSELSSRLLRQVVSPHDYLHFCRWSCTGESNRKGNWVKRLFYLFRRVYCQKCIGLHSLPHIFICIDVNG